MEAVKIVSYFSDTKDTIVSTRGRGGEIQDVYRKAAKPYSRICRWRCWWTTAVHRPRRLSPALFKI